MASAVQADAEYHGSLLAILTIVLVGVSLLVVLVRGIARYRISKLVEAADILLPLALVFALLQSACVRVALSSGLGSHLDSLTADQISLYEKLIYAGNLLFQAVLSLTQVIVVLLIKHVEPQRPVRIGCNCLLGLIAVYSALALSVLAFQCTLPTPWVVATNRCVDRETFLTAFIVASIAIDGITLILLIVMMCKVSTSRDRKIFVCALFGTRLALPIVTVPQIYHLQAVIVSKDPTWDLISFQTWVQIVMNLGVITACLPSLGHVMWEMWTFGTTLRSSWSGQSGKSKDFGHELEIEHAPPVYQEKPHHIDSPGPAFYGDEKEDWTEHILSRVYSIGRSDSTQAVVGEHNVRQHSFGGHRELPEVQLPRTAHPAYPPPRRQLHGYRLPDVLSPVIERSPYIEGMTPQMPGQHWNPNYDRPPYPHMQPERTGPPSYAASSLYDEDPSEIDFSEIDIDSYYLGNTQTRPTRSEIALQSMIDDLQKENSTVDPAKRWEHGWI
ncbi:hypothetical protein EDD36DRAFT_422544 [Exophiala viscosa]|uniref:Rhodopsin domain-containing protein n=1 Tax=Exophiala viscosa TaxID=2486360 RepID=A0AAN6DQS8_9EURO|nr:hypothetical protein EDD36DRAFT_422544 [Exophiala viscosa]